MSPFKLQAAVGTRILCKCLNGFDQMFGDLCRQLL